MLSIDETTYPQDCGFVLRQLRGAIEQEEVRRYMRGEDLLLRDSVLSAEQVARAEQQTAEARRETARATERAERADERAEQAQRKTARATEQVARAQQETAEAQRETARAQQETARATERVARSIRRLHELGQSEGEIADALAIEVEQVRQVLGTAV